MRQASNPSLARSRASSARANAASPASPDRAGGTLGACQLEGWGWGDVAIRTGSAVVKKSSESWENTTQSAARTPTTMTTPAAKKVQVPRGSGPQTARVPAQRQLTLCHVNTEPVCKQAGARNSYSSNSRYRAGRLDAEALQCACILGESDLQIVQSFNQSLSPKAASQRGTVGALCGSRCRRGLLWFVVCGLSSTSLSVFSGVLRK